MKFVVLLLFCVVSVQSYRKKYCEICENHTFCIYSGGPSAACRNFDKRDPLDDADISGIVKRINERRNLVALGRLKKFPQAANMRKVRWSPELASFAQRWADQCDPSVKPNKEDECRDLVGMQVGQSIAAVVGPAPGLNVKSFVDMWFMLKLHYTGNVVFYNRSRDDRTNYFTQLIWADTEYVGCGKIKFFNKYINTVVERLVCNFAPKGNNHGKPVYALGFPATQCPKFMTPDLEFPGLCKQEHKSATDIVPDSSANLLRILDSSNSSAKQHLDPNNIKQTNISSDMKDQRSQKTRHAYLNKSNGAIKRDSFHIQNHHLNPVNDIDNFKGQFTPERGHSRLYHGNLNKIEPIQHFQTTQSITEQDFKRFDLTTTSNPPIQHDAPNGDRFMIHQNDYIPDGRRIISNPHEYLFNDRRVVNDQNDYISSSERRHFGEHVCTRKPKCSDCFPKPCETNQCTRGQSHSCNSCLKPQPCSSCLQPPLLPVPPTLDICPCKNPWPPVPLPPVPLPPVALSPVNLPPAPLPPIPLPVCPVCPSHNCALSEPAILCAKRRAQDATKSTQYNYYDLFPNIGLRSAEEKQQKNFDNSETEDSLEYDARDSELRNQVKESGHLQQSTKLPQDSRDIFYSSERKRRDFEDQITFKPFWQMDEYNKRPPDLKSIRYTTLAEKRNKKNRWTTSPMRLQTESITIKLENELIHNGPHKDHTTEKYLSFEELMHLRKLSTLEASDYEMRRFGYQALGADNKTTTQATTTIASKFSIEPNSTNKPNSKPISVTVEPNIRRADSSPTTIITANTPFIRLKQCTRKITCTWTALMLMTGSDGNTLTGVTNEAGGVIYNVEVGSRTPPGYVDGCTRTSTCTRDFMDRNILPVQNTSTEDSYADDSSTVEDEEYCEKRSLNKERRNLVETDRIWRIEFQQALTKLTPSTTEINHVTSDVVEDIREPNYKQNDCFCYEENNRSKRDESNQNEQPIHKICANRITDNKSTKTQNTNEIYSMLGKMSVASKSMKNCARIGTKTNLVTVLYWAIILNLVLY